MEKVNQNVNVLQWIKMVIAQYAIVNVVIWTITIVNKKEKQEQLI